MSKLNEKEKIDILEKISRLQEKLLDSSSNLRTLMRLAHQQIEFKKSLDSFSSEMAKFFVFLSHKGKKEIGDIKDYLFSLQKEKEKIKTDLSLLYTQLSLLGMTKENEIKIHKEIEVLVKKIDEIFLELFNFSFMLISHSQDHKA